MKVGDKVIITLEYSKFFGKEGLIYRFSKDSAHVIFPGEINPHPYNIKYVKPRLAANLELI